MKRRDFKKRLVAMLVAAIMVVGLFPVGVVADTSNLPTPVPSIDQSDFDGTVITTGITLAPGAIAGANEVVGSGLAVYNFSSNNGVIMTINLPAGVELGDQLHVAGRMGLVAGGLHDGNVTMGTATLITGDWPNNDMAPRTFTDYIDLSAGATSQNISMNFWGNNQNVAGLVFSIDEVLILRPAGGFVQPDFSFNMNATGAINAAAGGNVDNAVRGEHGTEVEVLTSGGRSYLRLETPATGNWRGLNLPSNVVVNSEIRISGRMGDNAGTLTLADGGTGDSANTGALTPGEHFILTYTTSSAHAGLRLRGPEATVFYIYTVQIAAGTYAPIVPDTWMPAAEAPGNGADQATVDGWFTAAREDVADVLDGFTNVTAEDAATAAGQVTNAINALNADHPNVTITAGELTAADGRLTGTVTFALAAGAPALAAGVTGPTANLTSLPVDVAYTVVTADTPEGRLALAESAARTFMSTFTATNTTSQAGLIVEIETAIGNVAVLDGYDFTVNMTVFTLTPATEAAAGSLLVTFTIYHEGLTSEPITITRPIAQLEGDGGDENGNGNGGGTTPPPYVPTVAVPSVPYFPAQDAATRNEDAPVITETVTIAGGNVDVRIVSGRATVVLPPTVVNRMIEESTNTATFDLSSLDIISAALPRSAVRAFARAGLAIEVALPQGALALSAEATGTLAAIAHTANVTFRIAEITEEQMPDSLLAVLPAGANVHQAAISAGSRVFRHFENTPITTTLPSGANARVWQLMTGARLAPVNATQSGGNVEFDTVTLGLFIVG